MNKPKDRTTGSAPSMADELSDQMTTLRDAIDRLDEQLVKLLNSRAANALSLGELKKQAGMDTYQPEREITVLKHARSVNDGPLENSAITRLFERIIDENRRLEGFLKEND